MTYEYHAITGGGDPAADGELSRRARADIDYFEYLLARGPYSG